MGARWTCERERNSCIYSFFLLLCAVQPSAEQSKAKQHSRYQAKLKMSDTSLRFVLTRCLELLSVLQLWCVWLNNQIVQRIDLHSLSQHHFASVCTIAWNELNRRTKKTDNENETKKNKKLDKLRVKVTNVPIDTEHTTHTHKHYIAVSGAILLLRRKTKKKNKKSNCVSIPVGVFASRYKLRRRNEIQFDEDKYKCALTGTSPIDWIHSLLLSSFDIHMFCSLFGWRTGARGQLMLMHTAHTAYTQ